MFKLLLFILALGTKQINKKRRSKRLNVNEILIPKKISLLPDNYRELNLKKMLVEYLNTSIIVYIQAGLMYQKFSGILIKVENDYIEILDIKPNNFYSNEIYKKSIISIPINKIAAVTYFQA